MSIFELVAFQEILEQRFDDVMNALKSTLSHVSRLENHHNGGISRKSGDGRFSGNNPCNEKNWNIYRSLLLPTFVIEMGTRKS